MSEKSDIVIGRNAVSELIRSGSPVDKILIAEGKRDRGLAAIEEEARKRSIPIAVRPVSRLNALAGKIPHQSVIAYVPAVDYSTVDDILQTAAQRGEDPFIVIADGVEDPRNLGAIIRCAECAGVHGVIIPKHKSVNLNAAVAKTSAGAISHVAVARVTNVSNEIRKLKEAGLWIYACEAGGQNCYETDLRGPAAFIFGSEGRGVPEHVKKNSDFIISIPMFGKVNSLNVSAAAAAVLSYAANSRNK